MPRFLSAHPDARLIPLPWSTPLAQWPLEHLVALPRGISRHVVRFISMGDGILAAKEIPESLAMHEYRMLHDLMRLDTPAVEPVAVVTGRTDAAGTPLDSVLITRYLQFSLPYRSLFNPGVTPATVERLIEAMAVLLIRLHLIGFKWGDVSLSNTLFRRDASGFAAHLVDAETGHFYYPLSTGQRDHDLDIARVNLFGEFCDLEAGGQLDPGLDPLAVVSAIADRYEQLWIELTGPEEFGAEEITRIDRRVQRLNDLGFDVAELDIATSTDGETVRIQPKVVDAGHHARRLLRLTGLVAEENQARRLLFDLDTYLREHPKPGDESTGGHRWLVERFKPVVSAVPEELSRKLPPAQVFHEFLDYRWLESEARGQEIPLVEAAHGYVGDVLQNLPDEAVTDLKPVRSAKVLANPYDPSLGYLEDDEDTETPPVDADGDVAPVDLAALAEQWRRSQDPPER